MRNRPTSPLLLLAFLLFLWTSAPARAGWGEDALAREAGYICDASWTEQAVHHAGVTPQADAYGAINDVRISESGPDWVRPAEASVAAVSLLAAARQLKATGTDTAKYDAVLGAFFRVWLLKNRQGWDGNKRGADFGGMASRVYYDRNGNWQRCGVYNAGATGMAVIALWKYGEYLDATGRAAEADKWRREAWPRAQLAGDFLRRCHDPTYHLIRANTAARDLWTSDSVYAADALRCLARWAKAAHVRPSYDYAALADQLTRGIEAMRESGPRPGFFKFRDSRAGYRPTNGQWLDQLCFLPFEADALSPKSLFARQISDWWTFGDPGPSGIHMTAQTDTPADWRSFGTHWHFYFRPRPENAYLYPGPGLQLAATEWKAGKALHDPVLLDRARKRFEWANRRSALWLGADPAASEANVPSGLVDWRDANDYAHTAPPWQRFVDTSAYFLQVTLMICYNKDTRLVPE